MTKELKLLEYKIPPFEVLEELVNCLLDMRSKELRLDEALKEIAEISFSTCYFKPRESITKVIIMLFNDDEEDSIIDHFIYECDLGNKSENHPVFYKKKKYILKDAEALYTFYKEVYFNKEGFAYDLKSLRNNFHKKQKTNINQAYENLKGIFK